MMTIDTATKILSNYSLNQEPIWMHATIKISHHSISLYVRVVWRELSSYSNVDKMSTKEKVRVNPKG